MREFSIGGRDFQLNKINAFKQFHIVRKIAPILTDLIPAMKEMTKVDENLSEEDKLEVFGKIASPIMTGLSKLSEADADKVLLGLLSSVEIKQSTGNWAKVATDSIIMMQDLELPILLQLAGKAFVYNLSGFFDVLPQLS